MSSRPSDPRAQEMHSPRVGGSASSAGETPGEAPWHRVRDVFEQALDVAAGERAEFVRRATESEAVQAEVMSLLAAHDAAATFIDKPVLRLDLVETRTLAQGPGGGPSPPDDMGAPATATEVDSTSPGSDGAGVRDLAHGEGRAGPYRLSKLLGQGGMGSVYLAVRDDDTYQKEVAVKLLRAGLDSAELVRRFHRERQILAQLEHPGIARLVDGGTTQSGRPYLVMERVVGTAIDRYCDDVRASVRMRLSLVREVCDAVQFAHRNLVVHRDLKPANILVSDEGTIKLLDFGIAKLLEPSSFPQTVLPTQPGTSPATPAYASPEQLRGDVVTTASDVYSLGVVLFELLAGAPPFPSSTGGGLAMLQARERGPLQRPSTAIETGGRGDRVAEARRLDRRQLSRTLAGDLDTIVLEALDPDATRRYRSASELADDIERYLTGRPIRARPDTWRYRASKFVQRHRLSVVASGVGLSLLLAALVLLLGQRVQLLDQRARILEERNTATEVSDFMADLFALPDPSRSRGEQYTARAMLDRGRREIAQRLHDQPRVRAALQETMGRSFTGLGLYEEGIAVQRESVAGSRQVDDPASLGVRLGLLAEAEMGLGDYRQAREHNTEALAVLSAWLTPAEREDAEADAVEPSGPEPETALRLRTAWVEALARQGRLLELSGEPEAGREALTQARSAARIQGDALLEARIAGLAAGHDRRQGAYEAAERAFLDALALTRATDGPRSAAVARLLNDLAVLDTDLGRLESAEARLQEAEAIEEAVLPANHPARAATISNRALVALSAGRIDEAERRYRDAIRMQEAAYGGSHLLLAKTLQGLAGVLEARGEPSEAETMYEQALAMLEHEIGPRHPDTAKARANLAYAHAERGALTSAEQLFRTALADIEQGLGAEHAQAGRIHNGLGFIAAARRDLEPAVTAYRKAVAITRKTRGETHRQLADMRFNLADALEDLERWQEAIEVLERAIEGYRTHLGDLDPTVLALETRLASLHLSGGAPAAALALAEQVYAAHRAEKGVDDPWTRSAARIIGRSLLGLERWLEAESWLVEDLAWQEARGNADPARVGRALRHLITLYDGQGRAEQADEYRQRLEAFEVLGPQTQDQS